MEGLIHIYCGDGKGKTTCATGLAVRAAGCGKKVLIVRFLKNNDSSELKSLSYIPTITIIPCEKDYGFFWNMTVEEKAQAKETYTRYFQKAIQMVGDDNYDMLVMDEILPTYNHQLIHQEELVAFLKNRPSRLEVVLTGRDPAKELVELADYVSNIQKVKHPFDRGIGAREGIEL